MINDPHNSSDMSQYTVLVVDDEVNILQSLQRIFRREPYRFLYASSGAEGLKLLADTPDVAVIVSDQRMPEMNGAEFLSRSREIAPDAIRMLLTGYSEIEATIEAMNKGGATRYISKPWEDNSLLQTVREAVNQYCLVMENRRQQEIINKQNEELSNWNANLKERVMVQTVQIRKQLDDLRRLNICQQNNFHGIIKSLASLVELRSPKSKNHSLNTATLSTAIARSLGLSADETETVRIAALLHDIGKNSMSDVALASEESDLTEEELFKYRKHPVLGQTAIDAIEELRPAGVLIRHHHERFDGKGFPDGLADDAIPVGAAIISLADRFDREIYFHVGGNSVERAVEIITTQAGTAFSPMLLPHLAGPAHDLYDQIFEEHDELTELEVSHLELRGGMILTRDLYSRSGLLLLQAFTELNNTQIEALQRIFTIDPKPGGIHLAIHHSR